MLDNKFFLTSVAKFLRRGRVDRGTGGGKVVVVGDSSKQKVELVIFSIADATQALQTLVHDGSPSTVLLFAHPEI